MRCEGAGVRGRTNFASVRRSRTGAQLHRDSGGESESVHSVRSESGIIHWRTVIAVREITLRCQMT